jgi:glucokinase
VADIGGTNTRVALAEGAMVRHDTVRRFANADHADLAAILRAYLRDQGVGRCAGAAVAVAGPVQDGVAEMTNLAWTITPGAVAEACGAGTVTILNDLQAQGHALDRIAPRHLRKVIAGAPHPRDGARLVIGVGTGFNAAPVHRLPGGRLVVPSECGHQTLPVRTQEDLALAAHVGAEHGFAGVEDVLSGRGVTRLYNWCAGTDSRSAVLSAAEVMQAIGRGGDAAAERTAAVFVRLLGCVTGDLALVHLPFRGIYLVGGVARAFAPHLDAHGFRAAFRDKGRFSDFMDQFPVHVIEDDFAALEGCADHLARVMAEA